VPVLDFTGASSPVAFLTATVVLGVFAFAGRKRQVQI
jgi:hypothetical protein